MAQNGLNDSLIKVLIVDDEQLVRKGLRLTVDWEKHGMAVVADAPNGSLGWEKFRQFSPQLVITDVVMPEMDGVELAAKIKQARPGTKILFLSCHRDFTYAVQGIQVGISDYIVKTSLDDKVLDECLEKVKKEIVEEMKRDAAGGQAAQPEDDVLGDWLCGSSPAALQPLKQRLEKEWKPLTAGAYVIHIYSGAQPESSVLNAASQRMETSFGRQEFAAASSLQTGSVFWLCRPETLYVADEELVRMKMAGPGIVWRKSGMVQSADQWLAAVHRLHRLRLIEMNTVLQGDSHKEEILQAIDYIEQHLHLDLRASEIAAKIGMSRSYFSTIFKEMTGESLISFISKRKLERAQHLLRATSLKTEEIAEKVGIFDTKYFSKWFKKCAALTPGQYRTQTK
ncbi:response regulator transcription factor [Paenibacillus hamazuiensis]|uniref:response regulator transcription factor n=1 Tax=Paenibacillus hamazuiensis TaxID=2936508 RepID=UPI00200F1DED|nr:response regulator [Paenibacillus hamazuiensis]